MLSYEFVILPNRGFEIRVGLSIGGFPIKTNQEFLKGVHIALLLLATLRHVK